jgi:hypothetical protein
MVKPETGQANFSEKSDAAGGRSRRWRASARRFRGRARRGARCRRGPRRVGGVEIGQALGELERGLEAVGEARLDAFADDDAVDHHLDVVLVFLVERRRVLDRVELAVDADAGEAGLLPLGELLAILALAAAHDRGEQIMARAFGQRHHAVDHLADLLRLDRQAGGGRIGHADARPQQAHVIVDLGDGGDGRARVAAGGLLLDRDGRRQAVDMLDVGLLHHLEELARVGDSGSRRSGAGPRHRWCRRRGSTCPSPTGR